MPDNKRAAFFDDLTDFPDNLLKPYVALEIIQPIIPEIIKLIIRVLVTGYSQIALINSLNEWNMLSKINRLRSIAKFLSVSFIILSFTLRLLVHLIIADNG